MQKYKFYLAVILWGFALGATAYPATYRYYGAHLTAQEPWLNSIAVFNNGDAEGTFQITIWDGAGVVSFQQMYTVPPTAARHLVMANFAGYTPAADEVILDPVEGTFVIDTDFPKIRPKIGFRYGDSVSLCEFFLPDTLGWEFLLPNTVEDHLAWTGMVIMNPFQVPLTVWVEAFRDGLLVDRRVIADIPPGTKYVRLSDGFWPGLGYADYDQARIYSCQQAFPPPLSITGNNDQDRHLFFAAVSTSNTNPCSELFGTDPIVGDLFQVPVGTFAQGRVPEDPCVDWWEDPFVHTLTQEIAVMATEVSRQMWADLRAARPELPADPTDVTNGAGLDHPVQNVSWFETILFANLLSLERGLTPCYYKDESFTTPVDGSNYAAGSVYCDWRADGYRLLTEGEWEYSCRAGTSYIFNVPETGFIACQYYCWKEGLPDFERVAWYCGNDDSAEGNMTTKPVGLKEPNAWGLHDMLGNVWEWCWDVFALPYPSGEVTDFRGAAGDGHRVFRGGDHAEPAYMCRVSRRNFIGPELRQEDRGFRLCRNTN